MKSISMFTRFKVQSRQYSSSFKKYVWTNERVAKSPCKDIVIPEVTLDEYIWMKLDKWPNKVAAVCGITNRSYKYENLYKKSRVLGANLIKKFRIDNGDAVAVMMRNSPEYPLVVLGILAGGGVVTTLNPVYTAYEVRRLLQLSGAKMIVSDTDTVPVVQQALKLAKTKMPIIAVNVNEELPEGTVAYKELVEDNYVDLDILKNVRRNHEDVSILPFSSGTTGLPKCVELTNFNMVANCEQQNTELRQYSYTTESNQDSSLAILPLFHSYGMGILMLHKLSNGLKLVTLPRFQPETFLNALLKNSVNLLYVAPPMMLFLGNHPLVTEEHLKHLRTVACGAAPLPVADINKFLDRAPKYTKFSQGYGMTEAAPLVSASHKDHTNHESVGFALPNIELRVIDGDMNNLGPGELGELVIKGPNIMKGYKDNPQANAEVFLEEGWYRSGDMAKIDEHGLINISDRLKELIKVNAYQVPPAELENVLKDHPDVLEAAVIGVPDPNTGEKPKAFVVLKQGTSTTDKQVIKFVGERVAPYKRIKDVTFLESIPKNPSGKILKKVLKEKYC